MNDIETGHKWWVRHVIIPVAVGLIGGGGLLGLIVALINKGNRPQPPEVHSTSEKPAALTESSMEAEAKKAAERNRQVEELRQQGPPLGYTFVEGCNTTWTNFEGKRIWVRDKKGLACGDACPPQPLGVYIEQDMVHYYDAGAIGTFSVGEDTPSVPTDCFPAVDGVCIANVASARVGEAVTFTAYGYGGTGFYAYLWTADENKSSNRRELTTSFATPGIKSATLRVVSNGQTVFRTCRVIIKD
jgi:hypothetical protein